jgi:hypothetical protein
MYSMKKLVGCAMAHLLYLIGDKISMFPNFNYNAYRATMNASNKAQEWSGSKSPWKKVSAGGVVKS